MVRYATGVTGAGNGPPTIGFEIRVARIDVGAKRVKLQVSDTAGIERYRTITASHLHGAQGIMLFYSVVDRRTFVGAQAWRDDISRNADARANIALVGTHRHASSSDRVRIIPVPVPIATDSHDTYAWRPYSKCLCRK